LIARIKLMFMRVERDLKRITSFCVALSKDNGKIFGEKIIIFIIADFEGSRMKLANIL